MTTKEDIRQWLKQAPKDATHMLVVCDTFEYEDYPVYVKDGTDPRELVSEKYSGQNMQRLMEVYDLRKPLDPQLAAPRAYNY